MRTVLIKINPARDEGRKIRRAADAIIKGGIVAFPTETVYGLAVSAADKEAVKRLYFLKGRPQGKKLPIQIHHISQLGKYVRKPSPRLKLIVEKFWPGPLTVIVKAKKGDVALRMPDNKTALEIIKETGVPVAVTSANKSGERPLFTAGDVLNAFNGRIDMIVDDGATACGIESTVLDCRGRDFKVLRKGAIYDKLKPYLKKAV